MWNFIDRLSSFVTILLAIPVFYGAYLVITRARRYRKLVERMEKNPTPMPMALAISLAGIDITGQVRQFLAANNLKMEVQSFTETKGVTRENIHKLLHGVLKVKARMTEAGATEVHLFLACPLVFAAAVGALLDNWVPVKVYHLNRERGQYEFWTPLYKGFVPGLETSVLADLTEEQAP
jgi:hypothetical protein